jgi:hypothetical protein
MAEDLIDAMLAELAADPNLRAAAGGVVNAFESHDPRGSSTPYPYAVLVNVSARYDNFTGRGDATDDIYFDLHWLDVDSVRARLLVRLSTTLLVDAARNGRLDTDEGAVALLLPSSHRSHVDPRLPVGVGGESGVVDASVQLRVQLKSSLLA